MEIFQTVIVVAVIIVVALIITGVVKAACRIRKGRASGIGPDSSPPAATSGSVEAAGGLSQTARDQPPSYVEACPANCIILVPSSDGLNLPPSYDAVTSTSCFLSAPGYALYPLQQESTSPPQLLAGAVASTDRCQQPPADGASATVTTDGAILLMGRPSTLVYAISATVADELLPPYESVAVPSSRPLYAWI